LRFETKTWESLFSLDCGEPDRSRRKLPESLGEPCNVPPNSYVLPSRPGLKSSYESFTVVKALFGSLVKSMWPLSTLSTTILLGATSSAEGEIGGESFFPISNTLIASLSIPASMFSLVD